MSFLFTDIVGSTRKWEEYPAGMPAAIERHDELLDVAVDTNGGRVFHRAGDGLIASFPSARNAISAAADGQRALAAADWSAVGELRVRMGVHQGLVVLRDGDPFGWALNFGARFSDTGQGGQVLLSRPVVDAIPADELEPFGVRALGSQRLRDIARPADVYQLLGPGLEADFPALRDASKPPPLRTAPNTMIDRVEDIGVITRSVASHRLITLVGPPGVGKSRVVVEVANIVREARAGGARRCNLAGVADEDVVDTIATSLGVTARPGRTTEQSLADWLADQDLLLVLDHCEVGRQRVAGVVRSILDAAPDVSIVCNNHRPLGVAGEHLYRLGPLEPDDAVALFVDRAPGAAIDDSPELRSLCEQLDNIPFAIEVAAAQAALYSVEELADILGSSGRTDDTGPNAELRSLVDALALGVDALPDDLRPMLLAAAVFPGRFDRAAFAEVCAPTSTAAQAAAALTELVNRSLVSAEPSGGQTYFRLLHGVREFVGQHIDDDARSAAEDRFLDWAVRFADDAAAGLRGADELRWNLRVGRQFDNVRGAFVRAIEAGDLRRSAAIATVMWEYGFMRMNDEYFRWSERIIAEFEDGDDALLAPVYGTAAIGAWLGDDVGAAIEWANRAIELERQHVLPFDLPARLAIINATVYSGAKAPPLDVYAESAEYQRSRDELYFTVNVDAQNSIMATWLDQREAATRRGLRAVRVARESGNPSSLAFALWALGSSLEIDDPLHAESLLANSLEIAREAENLWITALVQMSLVSLRRRTSGAIDAAPILLDLLDLLTRAGHRSHLWHALRLCGLVLGDLGDDELAVQLAAWMREERMAMPSLPVDDRALAEQDERVRSARGESWVGRVEMMTVTWTPDTAAALVREALERHLAGVAA